MSVLGLYVHVPFCFSKCPYCDFYSLAGQDDGVKEAYTREILRRMALWRERLDANADTLYFGGGTPSLLGGERLARIIREARRLYGLQNAEITLEANPGDPLDEVLAAFADAGGNRLSLGMQSAVESELRFLGRRHTLSDVTAALRAARAEGIANFSLDLMLGLAGQTGQSAALSVQTAAELGASHVSAYLLKVEENTPFFRKKSSLNLPDDDRAADLYLAACEALDDEGFHQYEISNFSMPGRESRHNLKYWNLDPYLGLGPSAHSFLQGRRFAYTRDLPGFLAGADAVPESEPDEIIPEGGEAEYLMLRLRLTAGVEEAAFCKRFGHFLPAAVRRRAAGLPARYVAADSRGVRLTREGFLLSNVLTARLLGIPDT